MISKILVATDGSKVAWKSVEYAVELAKQTDATITLLFVIERNFMIPAQCLTLMLQPISSSQSRTI